MKDEIGKIFSKKGLTASIKKYCKNFERYEKVLNAVIEYCVEIENGYADGLYPENMKVMASDILYLINNNCRKPIYAVVV